MNSSGQKGTEPLGDFRHLAGEASRLAGEAQSAAQQLERYLVEQMRTRPYRTLLIAAGAGYVLGGGLASSLTRELARTGLRSLAPSLLTSVFLNPTDAVGQNVAPTGTARRAREGKKEGDDNDVG
jgi:hypothetical protein